MRKSSPQYIGRGVTNRNTRQAPSHCPSLRDARHFPHHEGRAQPSPRTEPGRSTMKFRVMLATLAAALPASADCTWEWLCNGDGVCKHMPVCDSVFDNPPPKPADNPPPAMPPISMRPHKIPGPQGTLTCEHIMRKGKSGRWYWHEA